MRLTLYTDYALRGLIHVAIADGKLITISVIAESFDKLDDLVAVTGRLGDEC